MLERIANRDEWLCWLCDQPVEPNGKGRQAPTLDHVVPLSKKGKTNDSNLRLAHGLCNSRRKSSAPDLRWLDSDTFERADLFQVFSRANETWENVCLSFSEESAVETSEWLSDKAARTMLNDGWESDAVESGGVWRCRVRRLPISCLRRNDPDKSTNGSRKHK